MEVSHIFISSMSSRIFCASSSLAKIQVSPLVILMPPPMSTSALPRLPSLTPGVLAVAPADAASVNVMETTLSFPSTVPSPFTSVLAWETFCWKPYSSPHSNQPILTLPPAVSVMLETWHILGS